MSGDSWWDDAHPMTIPQQAKPGDVSEEIKIPPALQCSQGGVPYNDFYLKQKDLEIARLKAALALSPKAPARISEQEMRKLLDAHWKGGDGYYWDAVTFGNALQDAILGGGR